MGALDGRDALAVSIDTPGDGPYLARLNQTISFPGSFAVWVHPGRTGGDSASAIYGLEFDDGTHRLWVLFGERDGVETEDPTRATIYRNAPPGEWSRQIVDIAALYEALGWPLPEYSTRNRSGLEFDARYKPV
jgi:hypothetical protein